MTNTNYKTQAVTKVLMLTKKEEDLHALLHDLFTESEIQKAYERIKIFECLALGMSQRETVKKSGTAIATVSHGAKFLKNSSLIIRKVLDSARTKGWWNKLIWKSSS